ncbi:MAG TPA: hypothetical protein VIX80_04545 [Candidatus Kapabacteria bacterium]
MKTLLLAGIISLVFLTSCATTYNYRLPGEDETKRFGADSLRWKFEGAKPVEIPVVDTDGKVYRLPVTEKLKIEVKTTEGVKYRFYLQSIAITGAGSFLGENQMWRGYDLLSHTERTIMSKEVLNYVIISDDKAIQTIGLR